MSVREVASFVGGVWEYNGRVGGAVGRGLAEGTRVQVGGWVGNARSG